MHPLLVDSCQLTMRKLKWHTKLHATALLLLVISLITPRTLPEFLHLQGLNGQARPAVRCDMHDMICDVADRHLMCDCAQAPALAQ